MLLKLLCRPVDDGWTYQELADELVMSASEVHAALKRCHEAGLYNPHTRHPNEPALREFLVHGLRYVFPARPGPIVQGLPTSYAMEPLKHKLRFVQAEAPVMPLPGGPSRGPEIKPLYTSAPKAAKRDPRLHELLAVVDALRTGRLRERHLAEQALEGWMNG